MVTPTLEYRRPERLVLTTAVPTCRANCASDEVVPTKSKYVVFESEYPTISQNARTCTGAAILG